METWSSCSAEVGIVSMLAGLERCLFSDTKEAAVYWTIMKPEFKPPDSARNAGNFSFKCGFTNLSILLYFLQKKSENI